MSYKRHYFICVLVFFCARGALANVNADKPPIDELLSRAEVVFIADAIAEPGLRVPDPEIDGYSYSIVEANVGEILKGERAAKFMVRGDMPWTDTYFPIARLVPAVPALVFACGHSERSVDHRILCAHGYQVVAVESSSAIAEWVRLYDDIRGPEARRAWLLQGWRSPHTRSLAAGAMKGQQWSDAEIEKLCKSMEVIPVSGEELFIALQLMSHFNPPTCGSVILGQMSDLIARGPRGPRYPEWLLKSIQFAYDEGLVSRRSSRLRDELWVLDPSELASLWKDAMRTSEK